MRAIRKREASVRRRTGIVAGLLVAAVTAQSAPAAHLAFAAPSEPPETTLEGRAALPADTFAPGPPSGSELTEEETKGGREPPFEGQPVGGISAVLDAGGGEYLMMTDNGFGQQVNSADFLLRVYRIRPDFETAQGGSGEIRVEGFTQLRDPERHIPFEITNQDTEDRLLTGADFDVESVRITSDGTLWFGGEFGPFLLHTDASGRVLEPPVPLPGVKSPESPDLGAGEEPNLPTSKGFEGMAVSADGRTLYPMLEGALEDDEDPCRRNIYEFDVEGGGYTGEQWSYRTEAPGYSIGDLTALEDGRLLIIERDDEQGEEAGFKKVYLVDLRQPDGEGSPDKEEVVDLLSIRDPAGISLLAREGDTGLGDPFSFPFQTIESVLPLPGGRLLLINDNNYPLSAGRNPDRPDDTEAIVVRPEALSSLAARPPETGGPPPVLLLAAGSALGVSGVLVAWGARRGGGDT